MPAPGHGVIKTPPFIFVKVFFLYLKTDKGETGKFKGDLNNIRRFQESTFHVY